MRYTREQIYINRMIVIIIFIMTMITFNTILQMIMMGIMQDHEYEHQPRHNIGLTMPNTPTKVDVLPPVLPEIPQVDPIWIPMDVPSVDNSFKAWMDYRSITDKSSDQWALQQIATTNPDGFRMVDGMYMVAMGTYYADRCGEIFEITFDKDNTIRCIVGDIKADSHTDPLNQHTNGNVVEFIVDSMVMNHGILYDSGDVSDYVYLDGSIVSIRKFEEPYNYQ